MSTYCFVNGYQKYSEKVAKRFLFGEAVVINETEILKNIESSIPKSRKLVLVGHEIQSDLRVLRHLGFDESSVIGIIDTQKIACEVLSTEPRTLGNFLTEFEYPSRNLHCAGNDAHFTLRLLLLLTIRSKYEDIQVRDKIALLKRIAWFKSSIYANPHVHAAKKRAKRIARNRKHQSKHWDLEVPENVKKPNRNL